MIQPNTSTNPTQRWLKALSWSFFRVILMLCVIILALTSAAYVWLYATILSTLPADLSEFRNYRPRSACLVYSADKSLLDEFYVEKRVWVPANELPDAVKNAFVAAEDRRFFKHPGIDFLGVLRALLINLTEGNVVQGGSTLTQQLVKNLIVGNERSYKRKIKEAILAWRLENELKKSEILELYMNYVYLGSGNYGVEAAALDYFSLPARDLNAGQAALLAGLVKAPSHYSPRVDIEAANKRRKLVLQAMLEDNYLTPQEAQDYLQTPITLATNENNPHTSGNAYRTQVRREVRRLFGEQLPFTRGFKVFTAMDPKIQKVAERAIYEALYALEERQGRKGASKNLPLTSWADFLMQAPGIQRDQRGHLEYPRIGSCFEALVAADRSLDKLRAGNWLFSLQTHERRIPIRVRRLQLNSENAQKLKITHQLVPLEKQIMRGDVLRVCLANDPDNRLKIDKIRAQPTLSSTGPEWHLQVTLDKRPWSEGAAIVLENVSGRIIALVGGYKLPLEGFIRATQAKRQPGSSFKPYLYAAALLKGYTQFHKVLDGPLALPAGGGKVWSPHNYHDHYAGLLPLRTALAHSVNTIAVRLLLDVGTNYVIEVAKHLGITSPLKPNASLALGTSEVTLLEQVLAYATIARLGVTTEPVYIDRLVDVWDQELARAGERVVIGEENIAQLPGGAGKRVLPAGIAYELIDMLREVIISGTGRSAFRPGFDRAGKTGTTNNFVDAWFMGFTPRYTVGVWIGTDSNDTLGDKETGSRTALPAWIKIVQALPHKAGERFHIPAEAWLVKLPDEAVRGLPRGVRFLKDGAESTKPAVLVPSRDKPLPGLDD